MVVKFSEKDFSGRLTHYVERMLETGSLPEKVGEHSFLLKGNYDSEKDARLYLSDTVSDQSLGLHSLTAKYDSEMRFEGGSVPVHSDIIVEDLRDGYFRTTYESSKERFSDGQLNQMGIESSKTYEFDIGGDLITFIDKNKRTDEIKTMLQYGKNGVYGRKIIKDKKEYAYGDGDIVTFDSLRSVNIDTFIDGYIEKSQGNVK